MLDEISKAILVVALMPDGTVRVAKNKRGSRLPEDGIRTLADNLGEQERALLFRLLNAPDQKLSRLTGGFTSNDAGQAGDPG